MNNYGRHILVPYYNDHGARSMIAREWSKPDTMSPHWGDVYVSENLLVQARQEIEELKVALGKVKE
jgi:hypothetical protein